MATVVESILFVDEVAEFFATRPSREQVLAYRPSDAVQERFHELVERKGDSGLTAEEEAELSQFEQTEILLRLIKARLRGGPGEG